MAKVNKRANCYGCWSRVAVAEDNCQNCRDRMGGTVEHAGASYKYVTWMAETPSGSKERIMTFRDATGKVVWDLQEPAPIARMISWFLDYMDAEAAKE